MNKLIDKYLSHRGLTTILIVYLFLLAGIMIARGAEPPIPNGAEPPVIMAPKARTPAELFDFWSTLKASEDWAQGLNNVVRRFGNLPIRFTGLNDECKCAIDVMVIAVGYDIQSEIVGYPHATVDLSIFEPRAYSGRIRRTTSLRGYDQ